MAQNYDDDFDNREDEFEDRGGGRIGDAARQRCSVPGLLLMILGVVGFCLSAMNLYTATTKPTMIYDMVMDYAQKQPAGADRDKLIQQITDNKENLRMDNPINMGTYVVGILLHLAMIIGGLKMRALQSYPLALIGAISGLIPIGGCCCFAIPVGLWAIIVLMNADVKRAFDAVARRR